MKTDTVEMLEEESGPYRGDNSQQTVCEGHAGGGWEQGGCWNFEHYFIHLSLPLKYGVLSILKVV